MYRVNKIFGMVLSVFMLDDYNRSLGRISLSKLCGFYFIVEEVEWKYT